MNSILKVENLSFSYNNERFVLQDINTEFKKGTFYGIFGKSGAGKSTLLSLLAGLETSPYGHIYYKNKDCKGVVLSFPDENMMRDVGSQPIMSEQALEDAMIIAAQSNPSHV